MILSTSCRAFARAFGAVCLAASDDETRPHLHCVHVVADDKRVMFEASNGHWMSRWTLREKSEVLKEGTEWTPGEGIGNGVDFVIPLPTALAALAAAKREKTLAVDLDAGEIRVFQSTYRWVHPLMTPETPAVHDERGKVIYAAIPPQRVDFPRSDKLWPNLNREPEQGVFVSVDYLSFVAKAFKTGYVKPSKKSPDSPSVAMNLGSELDPIVFTSTGVPSLTCLVMPCRK